MALVVGTDTYADVATVDAYHAKLGNSDWTGEEAVKEQAILRAMQFIEQKNFIGTKAKQEQPLEWPRTDAIDRNGYLIEDVPQGVIDALCKTALKELESPNSTLAVRIGQNIKKKKVDVLETEYFEGTPSAPVYTDINASLRGLVTSSTSAKVIRV